jgi:hypothetical protein
VTEIENFDRGGSHIMATGNEILTAEVHTWTNVGITHGVHTERANSASVGPSLGGKCGPNIESLQE